MKKKLTVKQKHRYTHQSLVLYCGESEYKVFNNQIKISYIEDGSACKVMLDADEKHMKLERIGSDIHTKLFFIDKESTEGCIQTQYGTIEVQIYTYKYIRKENVIAVEYDISIDGEVTDGYRFIWKMQEGAHESDRRELKTNNS